MNAPRYRDARLKIERAEKHIADLEAAIDSLEDSCIATIEYHGNGGQTLKHEIPDIGESLEGMSLIAGDAIHNLRSALDYAWYSTVERLIPDKLSPKTSFPIRPTRIDVEAALHGIEVDTRCKELFECVVFQIQPYDGSANGAAWRLHQIDISDKHLLLLSLDQGGSIGGIAVRDQNGELHKGGTWHATGLNGGFVVNLVPGLNIEEKGKLSVTVTLQQANPFQTLPIVSLLNAFRNFALHVVKLLEYVGC